MLVSIVFVKLWFSICLPATSYNAIVTKELLLSICKLVVNGLGNTLVVSLTKSAAKELIEHNIRVNAIAPGMVGTERFTEVFETKFKDKIANIGMGRLATPNEIADVCVFLASDLSNYVTGQIIGVDGSTSF